MTEILNSYQLAIVRYENAINSYEEAIASYKRIIAVMDVEREVLKRKIKCQQ